MALTVTVEVSARAAQNIDQLLEMILPASDIGELRPTKRSASARSRGQADKGRGPVATVLVQDGTLARRRSSLARSSAASGLIGSRRPTNRPAVSRSKSSVRLPQPGDVFQSPTRQGGTSRPSRSSRR
jgi:hypothetical protein